MCVCVCVYIDIDIDIAYKQLFSLVAIGCLKTADDQCRLYPVNQKGAVKPDRMQLGLCVKIISHVELM